MLGCPESPRNLPILKADCDSKNHKKISIAAQANVSGKLREIIQSSNQSLLGADSGEIIDSFDYDNNDNLHVLVRGKSLGVAAMEH